MAMRKLCETYRTPNKWGKIGGFVEDRLEPFVRVDVAMYYREVVRELVYESLRNALVDQEQECLLLAVVAIARIKKQRCKSSDLP